MIVLDTHVIIWDALSPRRLSAKAREVIRHANESSGIILCEISYWEIAMLMHKGRIQIDAGFREFIRMLQAANNYRYRGISPETAELATTLPQEFTNDPADRIIAATAILDDASLVTADRGMRKLKSLSTLW